MIMKDLGKKMKAARFFSGGEKGGKEDKGERGGKFEEGWFGSFFFSNDSFRELKEEKREGSGFEVVSRLVYFVFLDCWEEGKDQKDLSAEWETCFFYEPLLRVRAEMDTEEEGGEDFFSKALEFSLSVVSKEKILEWEYSRLLLLQLLASGNIVVFEPFYSVFEGALRPLSLDFLGQ